MAQGSLVLKNFKGLNLSVAPRFIEDNELAWAQDCFPEEGGIISWAPRPKKLSQTTSAATPGVGAKPGVRNSFLLQCIDSLGRWHPMVWMGSSAINGGPPCLAELNATTFAVSKYLYTGSSNEAYGFNSLAPRPGHLVWRNKLYMFPGVDFGCVWYDAAAFDRGYGTRMAWGPKPSFGFTLLDSFVLGGFSGEEGSLLRFTEVGDPATLLSDSKAMMIGPGDGDNLLAGANVSIQGGSVAVDQYGVLFKNKSVWMLQGAPPTSTSNGTLKPTKILKDEGLVSPSTICDTPHGLMWCSGQNVWLMKPGELPVPVGNKISKLLRTLPRGYSAAWHATYSNGVYRLSTPFLDPDGYGTLAGVEGTGSFLPSTQFWLDMRNGPDEASWWGPILQPLSSMMQAYMGGGTDGLLGLYVEYTTGTPDSALISVYSLGDDDPACVFSQKPVGQWLIFKEFDFGDSQLEKLIDVVTLEYAMDGSLATLVSSDHPLVLTFQRNGGSGVQTTSPSVLTAADSLGLAFMLDTVTLGDLDKGGFLADKFIVQPVYPGARRFMARTFQPQLKGTTAQLQGGPLYTRFKLASMGMTVRALGRRPTGGKQSGST